MRIEEEAQAHDCRVPPPPRQGVRGVHPLPITGSFGAHPARLYRRVGCALSWPLAFVTGAWISQLAAQPQQTSAPYHSGHVALRTLPVVLGAGLGRRPRHSCTPDTVLALPHAACQHLRNGDLPGRRENPAYQRSYPPPRAITRRWSSCEHTT